MGITTLKRASAKLRSHDERAGSGTSLYGVYKTYFPSLKRIVPYLTQCIIYPICQRRNGARLRGSKGEFMKLCRPIVRISNRWISAVLISISLSVYAEEPYGSGHVVGGQPPDPMAHVQFTLTYTRMKLALVNLLLDPSRWNEFPVLSSLEAQTQITEALAAAKTLFSAKFYLGANGVHNANGEKFSFMVELLRNSVVDSPVDYQASEMGQFPPEFGGQGLVQKSPAPNPVGPLVQLGRENSASWAQFNQITGGQVSFGSVDVDKYPIRVEFTSILDWIPEDLVKATLGYSNIDLREFPVLSMRANLRMKPPSDLPPMELALLMLQEYPMFPGLQLRYLHNRTEHPMPDFEIKDILFFEVRRPVIARDVSVLQTDEEGDCPQVLLSK